MRIGVINSKSVYSRNRLPRLEVEKPEWEEEEEEEERKLKEWETMKAWDKEKLKNREDKMNKGKDETETMMDEEWRN